MAVYLAALAAFLSSAHGAKDVEETLAACDPHLERPLQGIVWGEDGQLLDQTRYTQPALFALEVALAVSPYVRRGHVDSTFYSHQSMLKTIELMLAQWSTVHGPVDTSMNMPRVHGR